MKWWFRQLLSIILKDFLVLFNTIQIYTFYNNEFESFVFFLYVAQLHIDYIVWDIIQSFCLQHIGIALVNEIVGIYWFKFEMVEILYLEIN